MTLDEAVAKALEERIHARLRAKGATSGTFEELVADQARDYAKAALKAVREWGNEIREDSGE